MLNIFLQRISLSFIPISAFLLLLVACSSGSDNNAGTTTGILDGPDDATISEVTQTILPSEKTYNDDEISDDDGPLIVRTNLSLTFHETATVAEINQLLENLNASLISSIEGDSSLVVKIPDPGSLDALNTLIDQIESNSFVWFVRKAEIPVDRLVPTNIDLSIQNPIDNHLAVRANAAWNARNAMTEDRPVILVADSFGDGIPNDDFDYNYIGDASAHFETSSPSGDASKCYDDPPDPVPSNWPTDCPNVHGYHVLGIITGLFGRATGASENRGLVTGIYPQTADVRVIDREKGDLNLPVTETAIIAQLVELKSQGKRVVLNTSFGPTCKSTAMQLDGTCREFETAMNGALDWINKVQAHGLEDAVLHVTAAENVRDGYLPNINDAETDSDFSAARLLPIIDAANNPVKNLTNTLVVQNGLWSAELSLDSNILYDPKPDCVSNISFIGGDLTAIGTDVFSFTDADGSFAFDPTFDGAGYETGTSMAAPQVAGLAAYMWSIRPDLSPQEIMDILITTAKTAVNTSNSNCWETSEPFIDAYSAVLALDDSQALDPFMTVWATDAELFAPVRIAILDVADNEGNPGTNNVFDEHDIKLMLNGYSNADVTISPILPASGAASGDYLDYSRHDLNGDGYTNSLFSIQSFDLDMDGKFTSLSYAINGKQAVLDETAVRDFEILCYYAYSTLYNGDMSVRDTELEPFAEECGVTAGRIAFTSNRDGGEIYALNSPHIYVMDSDGTNQNSASPGRYPVWSPDQSKLAYLGTGSNVFVINAEGNVNLNVSNTSVARRNYVWSPDSSQIAFTGYLINTDFDIFVVNADGTDLKNITNIIDMDISPSWAPDGNKIAYSKRNITQYGIYVMKPDGSESAVLLDDDTYSEDEPVWSPDGTKILYKIDNDIYVMNAVGSDSINLSTSSNSDNSLPRWSPDSTKIAFQSNRNGDYEIYVVNVDGTGLDNLTKTPNSYDGYPAWSPDGEKIVFESNRDGNYEIYTMKIDGSDQKNLSNNLADDRYPDW